MIPECLAPAPGSAPCPAVSSGLSQHRGMQNLALAMSVPGSNQGGIAKRRVAVDHDSRLSYVLSPDRGKRAWEHGLSCVLLPKGRPLVQEGKARCRQPEQPAGGDGGAQGQSGNQGASGTGGSNGGDSGDGSGGDSGSGGGNANGERQRTWDEDWTFDTDATVASLSDAGLGAEGRNSTALIRELLPTILASDQAMDSTSCPAPVTLCLLLDADHPEANKEETPSEPTARPVCRYPWREAALELQRRMPFARCTVGGLSQPVLLHAPAGSQEALTDALQSLGMAGRSHAAAAFEGCSAV